MGPFNERERISYLREYSFEEVVEALPENIAQQVDLHQINDMRTYNTPTHLWPTELEASHPVAIEILTNNTAVYDDEIEDKLYEDSLLQEFVTQMQQEPGNLEIAAAIRARRSVLVSLYLNDLHRQLSSC